MFYEHYFDIFGRLGEKKRLIDKFKNLKKRKLPLFFTADFDILSIPFLFVFSSGSGKNRTTTIQLPFHELVTERSFLPIRRENKRGRIKRTK